MKKIFFSLVMMTLLLSACASAPPEPVEISIDMSEYAFSPDNIELFVGQEVTFILENVGQLEHELMIGRTVSMHDGMPSGFETDFFEAGGVEPVLIMEADEHSEDEEHDMEEMDDDAGHGHEGFMAMVEPGHATATLSFTVTEDMLGEWEMGCFLLEGVHYTSGMSGSLTVSN
jgi:uncharacterized cupredoxin-like copper-binding protein